MEIAERIAALNGYFRGMEITTSNGTPVVYVEIAYPANWIVDEEINAKYHVTSINGGNYKGQIYFGTDLSNGIDTIFDCIEANIKKMKSVIERGNIFKEKTEELKSLFADERLTTEEVRTLSFHYTTSNGLNVEYTPMQDEVVEEMPTKPVEEDKNVKKKKNE